MPKRRRSPPSGSDVASTSPSAGSSLSASTQARLRRNRCHKSSGKSSSVLPSFRQSARRTNAAASSAQGSMSVPVEASFGKPSCASIRPNRFQRRKCGAQEDRRAAGRVENRRRTVSLAEIFQASPNHEVRHVGGRVVDAFGPFPVASAPGPLIAPDAQTAARPMWVEHVWQQLEIGERISTFSKYLVDPCSRAPRHQPCRLDIRSTAEEPASPLFNTCAVCNPARRKACQPRRNQGPAQQFGTGPNNPCPGLTNAPRQTRVMDPRASLLLEHSRQYCDGGAHRTSVLL